MANVFDLSIHDQGVVEFLRKNFRLADVYQKIIEQRIICKVALENDISVTPEEIEQGIETIRDEQELDYAASLMDWLHECHVTLADLQDSIRVSLLFKKVSQHLWLEQRESRLAQPSRRFDRIVLYKLVVPYEHLARKIFYQIEEEEISFFEAAHVYDVDENRRRCCGYEGYLQQCDLSPELAERLFNARIGELIGPIQAADTFYELFWIDDLILADLNPALQDDRLNQLFQDWMAVQVEDYLANPGAS